MPRSTSSLAKLGLDVRRIFIRRDATIPEDQPRLRGVRTGCPPSVLSCTAWGFSCLANCSASGELLPRLFTLACALLPKNRRCLFCDTFRHRNFATAAPASFTRHAAVWCSDFPLANLAIPQRSSAIGVQFSIISNPGNQELIHRFGRLSEILRSLILRCRNDLRSSINKIEKEATRSSRGVLTASGSPAFGRGIVR